MKYVGIPTYLTKMEVRRENKRLDIKLTRSSTCAAAARLSREGGEMARYRRGIRQESNHHDPCVHTAPIF